jgi:hypothetical protein
MGNLNILFSYDVRVDPLLLVAPLPALRWAERLDLSDRRSPPKTRPERHIHIPALLLVQLLNAAPCGDDEIDRPPQLVLVEFGTSATIDNGSSCMRIKFQP